MLDTGISLHARIISALMKNFFKKNNVSQDTLVTLFSQAPVSMCLLIGPNFIIEKANQQMLELWHKDQSVIGLPILEVLPEIKEQGFEQMLTSVYTTGQPFKGNKVSVFLRRNETLDEYFFNFIYAAVKNDAGEIIGVSAVATEITDQVESERKLRESEYRFEDLIKASDVSIAIYSTEDLIIELANNPMLKTWGKDASVIGKPLLEALPELEGQPFIGLLKEIFRTGEGYTATEDAADLIVDGRMHRFYFNFSYKPMKNSQGEVYAIYNMAVDVTDIVMARKKIEESEIKFRELADSMPQFVYTCNPEGKLTYINENWYRYTGFPRDEAMEQSILCIIKPEMLDDVTQLWNQSIQTGKPFEVEYEFRDPENPDQYTWFLGRAVAARDEHGNIKQWIGTFTDINEFKQLQKQKDNFLGIASHELKTPLTSLKLYTQFMEKSLINNNDLKNAKVAKKMDAQIDHLKALVDDLLDVTKIQNGQILLNETWFNFDELIEEVVVEQQMSTRHRIQIFKTDIGEIFADRHRLSQVMSNLISNAIKYSPDADEIQISAWKKDGNINFNVKDFGIGIPEDKLEKVFEQYYSVGGHKEHTYPGLGLGLYISSEIIKRTGGKIFVLSKDGKGSDFCFEIPQKSREKDDRFSEDSGGR